MNKASNGPTGSEPFHPEHQSDAANRDLLYDGNNLPYNPDLVTYARDLRKNATQTERMLWNYLKTLRVRVLRQRPIDQYIVDFYVPSKKLVIEIDGGQHYSEPGKQYDDKRTNILEGYGLTVMRFSNLDVRKNITGVCMMIRERLGL